MKHKSFKKHFHGHCRSCINKKTGVHFKHKNCEYWDYPEACESCGEVKNIVTGIRFFSRIMLWKIKEPKSQEQIAQDNIQNQ
ncbi:MAG: hypothetical protein IJ039_00175 [Clostridia bacterium]|nr:hypothetical protein [Clostridia bacterium]